jgi:hypothetical protein
MPDLQVNEGGYHHVWNNTVKSNNAVNFAARGSSVARVPGGTGAFVLAGHDVEFDHNTFDGNDAAALSVISYPLTGDPRVAGCDGSALLSYDYCGKMWPARVYVHDNAFTGNGLHPTATPPADCPDPMNPGSATDCPDPVAWQLSLMLEGSAAFVAPANGAVAPLVYDGMLDPTATPTTWGGSASNVQNICYGPANSNGSAYFLNLEFGTSGGSNFTAMTSDLTPFHCTLAAQTLADTDVTSKAP